MAFKERLITFAWIGIFSFDIACIRMKWPKGLTMHVHYHSGSAQLRDTQHNGTLQTSSTVHCGKLEGMFFHDYSAKATVT